MLLVQNKDLAQMLGNMPTAEVGRSRGTKRR